ncbi:ZBT25 protein, partial [Polyodon spathula]|nr:ZBT25 protein [Polyodon spathula]
LCLKREFGCACGSKERQGCVLIVSKSSAFFVPISTLFFFFSYHSECIKIQPTDIQPDVFSYLLHIMYTGMGPKQQVDQSRLQEGIQFLHAFPLYRNISTANQEAVLDAVKMSNLYGIQISSQMTAKVTLGLKDSQLRGLEVERSSAPVEHSQIQLPLAVGLEEASSDLQLPNVHGPASATSREETEVSNISVTIKQEKVEPELANEHQTSSPHSQENQSPCLFKGGLKPLFCHYCGKRCSSRSSLWEHLHMHTTGSLPLEVPGAISENNLGVVQKMSEDFDRLEDRPLQSYLASKNPLLLEPADAGSVGEAMRHSQSLALSSEELAAELKSSSPYSRKRKIACAICNLRFAQKSQLQEHMYTHTGKHSLCHRYNRFSSQLIQASHQYCENQAECTVEETTRDTQDNLSSCYSLDSEVSQESIDTVLVD